VIGSARAAVRSIDPGLPISNVNTMEQLLTASLTLRRFSLVLFSVFAALALVLAAIGIYGVISYSVTERKQEIGIRLALGAQPADVVRLVVGEGMKMAGAGVALGLIASLALTRLMTGLLFGISATDPLTFAMIALLLVFVALLACYIPARRATTVDPMIALRYE
jgi:putative ABC transport system permease protein